MPQDLNRQGDRQKTQALTTIALFYNIELSLYTFIFIELQSIWEIKGCVYIIDNILKEIGKMALIVALIEIIKYYSTKLKK